MSNYYIITTNFKVLALCSTAIYISMTWQSAVIPVNMINTVEMLLLPCSHSLCTFAPLSSLIHRPSPNISILLSCTYSTILQVTKKLGRSLGTTKDLLNICMFYC